jgi:hypothetical protein
VPGAALAMGQPDPRHRIGLVRRRAGVVWEWLVDALVAPGDRVEALDALDRCAGLDEAVAWQEALRS